MPADFHPGTAKTVAPKRTFKPTVAELPPGHPQRLRAIDSLVTRSFTAGPSEAARLGKALQSLNPSPDERAYVAHTSATRGDAAIRAKAHTDWQDFKHNVLPALAHAADVGVAGGLVGDIRHGRGKQSGVDAALLLPMLRPLRGARAALAAGRAVHAGEETSAVVKAAREAYKPRTLAHNDLQAQLPKARSPITRAFIEKPADVASTVLQRSGRAQRTPGVRLATAGERVAKAAGRSQRQERSRAEAAVAEHLKVLGKVKPNSNEDVGHFWYAQLPESHRNAEGLKLVRARQAQELQRVTSGEALAQLDRREKAVKAAMASATTDAEKLPHLRDLEEIKILRTDLPQQARDVAGSIARLDKIIAKAPQVNSSVVSAIHHLSADRQRILEESGRLDQGRAAERRGLVARWLGLEPSGGEAYLGHRLPKPEGSGGVTITSGGVGRPRLPQGVARENKLILARNGRVRQSVHVAAEDRAAATAFEQANQARNDLGKMGTSFQGHVPDEHVLVNPKGRTIPPNWRTEDLAGLAEEDTAHARRLAKEMVDGFLAEDPQAIERLKDAALEQGVHWDELRVVPKRLVDRYYSQFRSLKPPRGKVAKSYDAAVDAVATSIIFARLGYIPKNAVQNLVMAVPHQGAFLLVNAVRAAQVLGDSGLRNLIRAEIGFTGATGALGREASSQRIVGRIAGAASKVADDPIRVAAFLHEAAAAGVIGHANPILNEADRAKLVRLLTDKAQRPLLNDVRARSVDAMADFSRMTPDQARVARRVLVIPGWLLAGSRYPFHFAATHPVRSALLAYIGLGEPGAPDSLHFNRPFSEYFHGSASSYGLDTPWGRLRTNSLSPVNTPWELGRAAVATAEGKGQPFGGPDTAFDYAAPLLSAGVRAAQGEGVKRSLLPLAPNVKFAQDLAHPSATRTNSYGKQEAKLYPGDASRLGRIERELGVVPVKVDPEAEYKARVREGSATVEEIDAHTITVNEKELRDQLAALNAHGLTVPKEWVHAANVAQQTASTREVRYRHLEAALHRKLTAEDRYLATLGVLHEDGWMTDAQYANGRAAAARMSDHDLKKWKDYAWQHYGPGKTLRTIHSAYNKIGQP